MSLGGIIGGVAGGIVGFFIGGPAGAIYGASIGFGIGSFIDPLTPDIPTAGIPDAQSVVMNSTVGDPLPDALGSVKITGHLLAYGNERAVPVYAEYESGTGKGGPPEPEPQVTGYKYYMTWAVGICKGPINTLLAIYKNDDLAWEGPLELPASGGEETITINDVGSVTFYFGTNDQVANATMGTIITDSTLNSPLRNFCWALFDDCFIGEYPRCPTFKFVIRKTPSFDFSSRNIIQEYDYNPMHAIYYILNQMSGLPTTWLNSSDFTTVARDLFLEFRGISMLLKDQRSTKTYVETINNHIDGILRYETDAMFHPVLIRNDYDTDVIPTINEDVLLEEPTLIRPSWIDTVNEIKVQYTELLNKTRSKLSNVPWYCCGSNSKGQLGFGDTTDRIVFTENTNVSFYKVYAKINTFGVQLDGTMWGCGDGAAGELGFGNYDVLLDFTEYSGVWFKADNGTGNTIAQEFSAAITSGGVLYTTGNNRFGQLGRNDLVSTNTFQTVVGDPGGWTDVSCAGYGHLIGIAGGQIYGCGLNTNGQLGLGHTTSPIKVVTTNTNNGSGWTKVAAGSTGFSVGIKSGVAYGTGSDVNGALGLGLGGSYNEFQNLGISADDIGAGDDFSVILLNGALYSTGVNNDGRTGQGTSIGTTTTWTQIGASSDWSKIAVGPKHVLAIKTDGTLWGWGDNSEGQLGLGDTTDRTAPTQIGSDTDWTDIDCGWYISWARKD